MSSTTKCSNCGAENSPSAQYCANCGSGLAIVRPPSNVPLQIPVYPGSFSAKPIDQALARLDPKKRESVIRTRIGLIMMFFGILLGPIPATAIYAGLSLIAGAVLVFLYRRTLGERHQRHASRSFLLVIVGIVVEFVAGFASGLLFAISVANGGDPASALSSFFLTLYLLLTLATSITGLGIVFFTYDLQNATGRTLLWLAYSLGILISGVITLVIVLQVEAVSTQVLSQTGTWRDALNVLDQMFLPLRLLQFIPAVPYALAYRRAWLSVEKRVVQTTSPRK